MANDKTGNWFARHKVLTVIGIIVVIAIIAGAGGSKKDDSSSSSSKQTNSSSKSKPAEKKAETLAKIGETVRDGKFEFTVTAFKCGEASVGGDYLNKTAQGQFCRLSLSVKNIGNEAQTLDTSSQHLYNDKGQKYSSDSSATIYAAPSSSSPWYADVNPGNTITGDVMFDVPKDVTPITAELHDSGFSGGVKVSLQ